MEIIYSVETSRYAVLGNNFTLILMMTGLMIPNNDEMNIMYVWEVD